MSKKDSPEQEPSREEYSEELSNLSLEEALQKLNEAEAKANDHWERVLRMQAESENATRRAERDVASAHKFALEKFVSELIPIIDGLEQCATSVPPQMRDAAASVIEGVDLTLKMFYSAMEKFGVKQVNPVSQPFDPEFEQAISTQVDPTVAPNTVLAVLQKGYTLNNRLIRPALVVVSKAN